MQRWLPDHVLEHRRNPVSHVQVWVGADDDPHRNRLVHRLQKLWIGSKLVALATRMIEESQQ